MTATTHKPKGMKGLRGMDKCKDCGFLSFIDTRGAKHARTMSQPQTQLSDYLQVSRIQRESKKPEGDGALECFREEKQFSDEAADVARGSRSWRQLLDTSRSCHSYEAYVPGHTPKEHTTMIQLREERDWRAEQTKLERKSRRDNFRLILGGIIVAAVIALVAALIQVVWGG